MPTLGEFFIAPDKMFFSGQQYSICSRCGALVDDERRSLHMVWHNALERNGAERPKHEDYSEG
jgi:hypothetical protein